jgi:hypothetical protein
VGREEQDGDVLGAFALLDQVRKIDPAEPRHANVEDDRGKILPQHREQRFVGRLRTHHTTAGPLEHRLQRIEVPRLIVDDQESDVFVVHGRARD